MKMIEQDTLHLRKRNRREYQIRELQNDWSLFSTLYIVSDQSILYLVNNNLSDESSEPRKKKSTKSDADELKEVAEALPELFSAINDAVPKLISGLINSVYSPEAAGNMAAGIGKFYSNLIAEGIPEDVALDMTKKFVGALDFSKLMSMVGDEASVEISGKKRKRRDSDNYDDDEEFE